VLMNLSVLARISMHASEFERVLSAIVQLFQADRRLLETRGSLIVRKLCVLLNARAIYIALAKLLRDRALADLDFASIMVQTLNLILLTALELSDLRATLRTSFQPGASPADREVFSALFETWCQNPVSTLSLCLLAQAYDLSAALVSKFAEVEITVGFLMQIDKLVQLLESPIFVQLRLQLLDMDSPTHAALLKSLFGLLMVLPQSTAYRTLADRLATVSSLQAHLGALPPPGKSEEPGNSKKRAARAEAVAGLLQKFEDTAARINERSAAARVQAAAPGSGQPE